jgi:polyphosphate kinase 2 (PPK2 family)
MFPQAAGKGGVIKRTSNDTFRTCRRAARSSCSTAPGIIGLASFARTNIPEAPWFIVEAITTSARD